MSEIARARGLAGFTADVLAINTLMMTVFHKSGLKMQTKLADGCFHVTLWFEGAEPSPPPSPRKSTEAV